jgi:diaminopimelate epimerase
MSANITATYGHGTKNDFLLFFDPSNELNLEPSAITAMCDRRSGIGADGIIRIGRDGPHWFMDYRNRDGSLAEMCGNGIRVMARYLVERGHQNSGIFPISTRAGMKYLAVPDHDDISVNMGQVERIPGAITVSANGHSWDGLNINVGNPHAVVEVDAIAEAGPLIDAPSVTPEEAYPEGVNVEFIAFRPDGEIDMRVYERGVGETQSCGTGTCAVALAASLMKGQRLPRTWFINPPGGRLKVEIDSHYNATLTGPALLLQDHDVTPFFISSQENV